MADNQDDEGTSGLPAILAEWGDLLHKIPGAAKAVTKLVGSAAVAGSAWIDVATAKGEQQAAEIRGVTDARKKVREAMTKAAVKHVGADPDLGRRALEHFAEEIVSNQANREAVTKGALQLLSADPPVDTPASEISDDWLRAFSIYAERASSESVRAHWSAILAGEIRKPGSVSLMTIKMMSIIDAYGARLIQKYSRYIIKTHPSWAIPTVASLNMDPNWDDILALDAMGFLRTGTNAVNDKIFGYGRYRFEASETPGFYPKYQIQCSVVTQAGKELISIIGESANIENAIALRQEIVDMMQTCTFDIYDNVDGSLVSPGTDYPSVVMRMQEAAAQAQEAAAQSLGEEQLATSVGGGPST